MKRSFSNLIMKFVGVIGDVIWYAFLGYYSVMVIAYLMILILSRVPPIIPFDFLTINLKIIAHFLSLILFVFRVIILYNIRLLLKNISRKHFFFIENYRYFSVIGFALILSNFASNILIIIVNGMEYFIRHELSLGEIIVFNVYYMKYAILGIILLALAEVFRNGALMHDEQQLTV